MVSRREFTALAGASVLGLGAAQDPPSRQQTLLMLEELGGPGIFSDDDWLELLQQAVVLNAQTRAALREYRFAPDAEPTITFTRY